MTAGTRMGHLRAPVPLPLAIVFLFQLKVKAERRRSVGSRRKRKRSNIWIVSGGSNITLCLCRSCMATTPPRQPAEVVNNLQRSLAKQLVEDHGRVWPDVFDQPFPVSNNGEGAKYEMTTVEYVLLSEYFT